jgi:hypothetical protein
MGITNRAIGSVSTKSTAPGTDAININAVRINKSRSEKVDTGINFLTLEFRAYAACNMIRNPFKFYDVEVVWVISGQNEFSDHLQFSAFSGTGTYYCNCNLLRPFHKAATGGRAAGCANVNGKSSGTSGATTGRGFMSE